MQTVFSKDDLPKRMLEFKAIIANRFASGVGHEIEEIRQRLARQLAQTCVTSDDFVSIAKDGPLLSVRADVIVLTQDELACLMRQKFKEGMEHAARFNTPVWMGVGDGRELADKAKPQEGNHEPL